MDAAVVKNLIKDYNTKIRALNKISLNIPMGKICCLLGKNGAGKTTFLRILATQLKLTSGSVKILDFDVDKEPEQIRKKIAVIPQEAHPSSDHTPWELIYYYARLQDISKSEAKYMTMKVIKDLELDDYRDIYCRNLSGGFKRRVLIGMMLVRKAEIYFLDEPTIGLDVIARQGMWKIIKNIVAEGKTVLLTTHYMDEAQALSDMIAIIDRGELVTYGSLDQILTYAGNKIRFLIEGRDIPHKISSYGEIVKTQNGVILYLNDMGKLSEVINICINFGLKISIQPPKLDDAFIKLVGGEAIEIFK